MGKEKICSRRLGFATFVGCLMMTLNLSTVLNLLKPYLRLSPTYFAPESMKPIIHNFSNSRSDVYEIEGDVRIHGISSTIFVASNHNLSSWRTRPYAQKMNTAKYRNVTEFQIKLEAGDNIPTCNRNLNNVPAVIFSERGHAENLFHAFADVLFPLFVTTHQFNQKVIFLVTNKYSPWISKFKLILEKLSKYDIDDIDKDNEILCFSRVIVGLKAPGTLFMHPSESAHFPMGKFRKFLRSTYSLKREFVQHRQPRMLIISRENHRRLINEREIGDLGRTLGFDVMVKQMSSNVTSDAKLVNSVDVLIGVHGAGLTNMVFLPDNAVVIQISPFGVETEAMICFEWAAESMSLRYLEYKVSLNESSLLGKYPQNSDVYKEPGKIRHNQISRFYTIYLINQDVNVYLDRFRKTLSQALELLYTRD